MKRYLLFDAGCTYCSALALRIEQEGQGWLQARSLRDPEMQAYLEQANHQQRWEPTLVEVSEEQVHVCTGWTLRRKLLLGLGPQRMWRILHLIDAQQRALPVQSRRRLFFRMSGALLGGLALTFGWQKALAALAASPGGNAPSYHVTTLGADEAKQTFEHHSLIQLASQHFGAVDWTQTNRFTDQKTGKSFHEVLLVSAAGVSSWLILKDASTTNSLVLQLQAPTASELIYKLFLPSGSQVATYTINNGKLVSSQVNQSAVQPHVYLPCVLLCIAAGLNSGKISQGCAQTCVACYTGHPSIATAIQCGVCAICARGPIGQCISDCS